MERPITTVELDSIAREGLVALRSCLTGQPSNDDRLRAEMTLKIVGHSNRRMSAETNRARMGLAVAKAVGATPEQLLPFWALLTGATASALEVPKKK